jgi:heat shock protein HslJ
MQTRPNSPTALLAAGVAVAALFAADAAEARSPRRDPVTGRRIAEPSRPRQPTRAEIMLYQRFPVGTRLAVVSINGQRPVAADRPAFTFSAGFRMAGFGGCNPVNADYRRTNPSDIRFGPLNFVERRCGGEIDRQERAIFWAIQGARGWRPHGTRGMTFTGVRGTVTFEPAF